SALRTRVLLAHLRQRILHQRDSESRDFLQATPAARDARLLLGDPGGVERFLGKRALAVYRLESRIDDVLRQRRVAADVALRRDGQPSRVDLAEDVTQVEVGLGDA